MIKKIYLNLLIFIICFSFFYASANDNRYRPVVLLNNNNYWTTFNSITGLTDSCRVGDVIEIKGYTFVYREHYDTLYLHEEGMQNELLYHIHNGEKKLIATKTYKKIIYSDAYKPVDTVTIDPLLSMEEDLISRLWGVQFEYYSPESWEKLKNSNLDSTVIFLNFSRWCDKTFKYSLLPENVSYLKIETNNVDVSLIDHGPGHLTNLQYFDVDHGYLSDSKFYLNEFRNSSKLQFLSINIYDLFNIDSISDFKKLKSLYVNLNGSTLDLLNLRNLKNLNYLSVGAWEKESVKNFSEGISKLQNLVELNLSYNKSITEINLLNDLNNLKRIDITKTAISDLSFLKYLKNVETFKASFCPLKEIPAIKLKLLKKMEILSTDLSKKQIESFKTMNNNVSIFDKWISIMISSLTDANKLKIRSGGTCHRNPKREKVLYLETDKSVVDSIISLIDIDDKNSGHYCACCGTPTLEFYKDSTLIEMFGYHHGTSFRWYNGKWYGDGRLTKKSSRALNQWLYSKGIKDL